MAQTTPWWAQNLPNGPDGYGAFCDFDGVLDMEAEFDATIVDTTNIDATIAISDANNGELLLTNGSADDDSIEMQWKKEIITLNALNKTIWVFGRLKHSDATQEDIAFGLAARDTTFITAVDNALLFRKDDGDTQIDQEVRQGGSTVGSSSNISTATTAYREYAIRIVTDANTLGTGTVTFYIDGSPVGSVIQSASLPTTEMAISFGCKNGEASAKTMTVDHIGVWYPAAR